MSKARFEWDEGKDAENQKKHGVAFTLAQYAFAESRRVIAEDVVHSKDERHRHCFDEVDGGILAVRFTRRDGVIRICGAGYGRNGKTIYERENE